MFYVARDYQHGSTEEQEEKIKEIKLKALEVEELTAVQRFRVRTLKNLFMK